MAVVLGRPITTELQIDRFAGTIQGDEKRRELFSHWQTETDFPRPFDLILAGFHVAYRYFKDIHKLEHNVSVANSRTQALKAGISILRTQERLFQQSKPHHCKVFNPIYASFDTIVLIAALCLVFPSENYERRSECIQVVEEGMQRLGIIGQYNSMAKSAHGVVCSLYRRLMHRPETFETAERPGAFFSNSEYISPNNDTVLYNAILSEISFDAVLPPRPTYDMFFNNISSTQVPFIEIPDTLPFDPLTVSITNTWNFEGAFSDASFWNWMNQPNY
ncbi:hypothetical protein N7536_010570 [Penicillium majusculum]|nr:hypothetical protein N7536_010570 [Penicillium majusculum]